MPLKTIWGHPVFNDRVNPKAYQYARQLRYNMTPAEKYLWGRIKRRQLMHVRFGRQRVLRGWILDFYNTSLKLAIEVDGHLHNKYQDDFRDKELAKLGITTLRFTNDEVLNNTENVLDLIKRQIIELIN